MARVPWSLIPLSTPHPGPPAWRQGGIENLHREQAVQQQNSTTRMEGASVTAALAAVHAESSANFSSTARFPGEDGGYSMAEVAQRDLDAALQLLVNRAQYITGASGAAIALRRQGRNDMLCRASSGSNAPELGALLSTEFGLSGESVRTRQVLRCDDAERDTRVNHEVCHQLGIASVMVMPVVNDDGVLGVLELFSGKANAFGARDLSAVQRLSEMVETAVRLAQIAESLPERLMTNQVSAPGVEAAALAEEPVLDGEVFEGQVLGDLVLEDSVLEEPVPAAEVADETRAERPGLSTAEVLSEKEPSIAAPEGERQPKADSLGTDDAATLNQPKQTAAENVAAAPERAPAIDTGKVVTAPQRVPRAVVEARSPETVAPKKPLFWS